MTVIGQSQLLWHTNGPIVSERQPEPTTYPLHPTPYFNPPTLPLYAAFIIFCATSEKDCEKN